jgi:hypothetical protein
VKKVLAEMPLPADLQMQGQEFNETLEAFYSALRDKKVEDAIASSAEVHDAQHELSHEIDAWMETNPPKAQTVNPFDVSLAQYYLDTAGFHGMADVLSDTQKIDSTFLSRVTRVQKVLTQVTWPPEVSSQAEAFLEALDSFSTALRDDKVSDAVAASDTVHDAQHELSHAIDAWLETKPSKSAEPNRFQVRIAQYYLDTSGFHAMAEALTEQKKIEPAYPTTVNRVARVLNQTTWTPELDEQAQGFLEELNQLAEALRDEKVEDAIALADTVHDAQHELSHSIDEWLGGEAADH